MGSHRTGELHFDPGVLGGFSARDRLVDVFMVHLIAHGGVPVTIAAGEVAQPCDLVSDRDWNGPYSNTGNHAFGNHHWTHMLFKISTEQGSVGIPWQDCTSLSAPLSDRRFPGRRGRPGRTGYPARRGERRPPRWRR